MGFFRELKELIKSILSWLCLLVGFAFFLFLFGLKEVEVLGRNIFLPVPTLYSFSSQVFAIIRQDLLPPGVELIVTNPLSAFLAQVTLSLLLAFILTLPYFLYKIIKYLSPALFEKEKKAVIWILLPSALLFFAGCVFAYFLLIPATFRVLYPFATAIGAVPLFSVPEFITLVFGIMVAVGVMFLLPVFMLFLSRLGVVAPDFWKNNWRYALLILLIFSAIITPDGTGISMAILSTPLVGLYFLGVIVTIKKARK